MRVDIGAGEWISTKWFKEEPFFDNKHFIPFRESLEFIPDPFKLEFEDISALKKRVTEFSNTLKSIIGKKEASAVIVVTHGFGIQICSAKFDPQASIFDCPHTSITQFSLKIGWID